MALTAFFAVSAAMLIPRIRINSDVTTYLPSDSPMREGLAVVEENLPALDIRRQTIRIVLSGEQVSDSLRLAVESVLDDPQMPDIRQGENSVYFQYSLPRETNGNKVKDAVRDRFGKNAIVEIEDYTGIPDHLPRMIATGFAIMLAILILMCPSLVEALLFMFTIGIAILLNFGTNAFLPSVSMITNALASVLQMALSLDYAIILSNRFRQVRGGKEKTQAMGAALKLAAPSILSSAGTTIASLMMLCFMRLRFGADFGLVLSKGVFCSLICTFTLLPGLMLLCDKAIAATTKRVPLIPTNGLAAFEHRFRVPIAIAFICLFVGSYFLQRKVPVSYSMTRKTKIMKEFPPQNMLLMVYPTAEEDSLLTIVDSLPSGTSCLSYPSIAKKQHTASEWRALYPSIMEEIPADALDLLFYAATHPERNEKFALAELKVPPGYGKPMRLDNLLAEPEKPAKKSAKKPAAPPQPPVQETVAKPDTTAAVPAPVDTATVAAPDNPAAAPDTTAAAHAVSQQAPAPAPRFTREGILKQREIDDMTNYLGVEERYLRIIYRMSRPKGGTMSAKEVMDAVYEKILGNKLYASMVPKDKAAQLKETRKLFDEALAAPPEPPAPVIDSTSVTSAVDPIAVTPEKQPVQPADTAAAPAPQVVAPEPPKAAPAPPTPAEELAILALSGKKCSAERCYKALRRAGISVKREEIDLLYLYNGYLTGADTTTRLSLEEILSSLDSLAANPLAESFLDSAKIEQRNALMGQMDSQLGLIRGQDWSAAVLLGDLPEEGEKTYSFIRELKERCARAFEGKTYVAGFSVMYDEMHQSFPRELLLVTLLTALIIFIIVALTFRTMLIPMILVSIVLTAVWLDVFVSGLGGNAILFMAYFIVQSILMGATIDYSILFTHYYRESRRTKDQPASLKAAFRGSIHTIMTSGMIIVLGTGIMMMVVYDPVIVPVLRSISVGALLAILLILLVLPALLSLLDRRVTRTRKKRSDRIPKK